LPTEFFGAPCSITKKQYRIVKVSVGTVKKSIAAIGSRWLARKASQLWRDHHGVASVSDISQQYVQISNPNFKSSPWIFGALEPEFFPRHGADQSSNFLAHLRTASLAGEIATSNTAGSLCDAI
jgi:hypothetical protein